MPRKKKGNQGDGSGKKKGEAAKKPDKPSDSRPRGTGASTEQHSATALMTRESPVA